MKKYAIKVTYAGKEYISNFEPLDDVQLKSLTEDYIELGCKGGLNIMSFNFTTVEGEETYYFPKEVLKQSVITLITKIYE